ncbi:MAG: hypothetical protein HZA48_12130 [Planctomycetes bacterium]|nr:hypothetical protein [Planctomycetota bacterium]
MNAAQSVFSGVLFILALICSTGTIPANSSIDAMLPENTILYMQAGPAGLDAAMKFLSTKLPASGDEESTKDRIEKGINDWLGEFSKETGANKDELKKALNSITSVNFAITDFQKVYMEYEPSILFTLQTDNCAFFDGLLQSAVKKSVLEETDSAANVKIYGVSSDENREVLSESMSFLFENEELLLCTAQNKYFCLSNNANTLKAFVTATKTAPAKSLATNAKYLKTKAIQSNNDFLRGYFDFAAFRTGWEKCMEGEEWSKKYWASLFEGLDFNTLGSIGMASSKTDGKFMSKTAFFTQGENQLAKTFFNQPAAENTLFNVMPSDSFLCIWANAGDGKATWANIQKWLSDVEPYLFENEDIFGNIKEAEETIGVTFDEIAGNVNGETAIFIKTGGEFGIDGGFACTVKDANAAAVIAKKIESAITESENELFNEKKYKDVAIRYNDSEEYGEFSKAAYCFLENKYFVFAGSCESLEKIVDEFKDKKTLAFSEDFKKKTAFLPKKASKLMYFDLNGLKSSPLAMILGSDDMFDSINEFTGSVSYTTETPGQVTITSDSPMGPAGILIFSAVAGF